MNASRARHPSSEQLQAFSLGRLDPESQTAIEHHVAHCDTCCEVLRTVPDDTLVGHLRSSKPTDGGVAQPPTAVPVVPEALANHARYRIVRLLGSGGMGVVFQAEHRLMERMVALKVIRRDLLDHPAAVERFQTEVRAAARLAHPNIVAAHDAEQAGDLHFLVMEYIPGISLARLVEQQGPLPVADACSYVQQAALGLQHAWQKGMVHRDIKPQNLMRTDSGQIKILDFGLARFATGQAAPAAAEPSPPIKGPTDSMTATGAVLGTPDYIAPEQATDSSRTDIRADIYSLGCTLYFLLAGETPFARGSVTEKVAAHRERAARPLSLVRPDVPRELDRIVQRMMAKDPSERYQTPIEAADALQRIAQPGLISLAWLAQLGRRLATRPRRALQVAGGVALLAAVAWLTVCLLPHDWRVAATPGSKPASPTAAASTASRQPTALVVIAQQDFSYPDYEAVRRALEQSGVKVVVASSSRSVAQPDPQSGGRPVKPDMAIEAAGPDEFDAVVFVGGEGIREYMAQRPGALLAHELIGRMLDHGKYVAAVNMGTAAIVDAHVLGGKRATGHDKVRVKMQRTGVVWDDGPVVTADHIITARNAESSDALVRSLRQALEAKGP